MELSSKTGSEEESTGPAEEVEGWSDLEVDEDELQPASPIEDVMDIDEEEAPPK
jgi:hypothetical protein